MQSKFAILIHCKSATIAEKLIGTYNQIQANPAFPYALQVILHPNPSQEESLAKNHQCLHFVEVEDMEHSNIPTVGRRAQGQQIVLMASPASDYLDLAIRHQVGNILYTDSIVPSVLGALTQRLLGEDFFGFGPFFPDGTSYEQHVLLRGQVNRAGLVERHFADALHTLPEEFRFAFHAQMNELVTNAIAYGVLGISSEQRDAHDFHFPTIIDIPPGQEIRVAIVKDKEKYGISVRDPGGSLTLLRVLQKLRRHTALPGEVIPQGIEDLTGRGLFIVSRQTRLVINILQGMQTEVILLAYFDQNSNRYKSLIINEKTPSTH